MVQPIMASLLGLGFPIRAANDPADPKAFAALLVPEQRPLLLAGLAAALTGIALRLWTRQAFQVPLTLWWLMGAGGLQIRDGRSDHALRQQLSQRGYPLRDGAVLLVGDQVLHGAAAIQWLCARMTPSAALLQLLRPLLATPERARGVYPLLLLARRLALAVRGLPADPDGPASVRP
jgi:hypothetical protein